MDILVANVELILISGLDAASLGFGVASTTLQGLKKEEEEEKKEEKKE